LIRRSIGLTGENGSGGRIVPFTPQTKND